MRVHVGEARGFVARHGGRFDLIEVALLDAFGASSAGLYALAESYLYTVEALDAYLQHLEPGGMLAITRWIDLPPRDMMKLFGTAVAALERRGVPEPGRQLALIRSWKTATLLVKNGAFTPAEIAAVGEFCRARSFDADYYPGMRPEATNRYNVLDASYFHDGALALLGTDREAFVERYKFAIAPATDDRPHFFHFFRWRTLPELVARKGQGGLPLIEWGYPVLIATLLQATAAVLLLIVLPLLDRWSRRRRPAGANRRGGLLSARSASRSCSSRSPSFRSSSCSSRIRSMRWRSFFAHSWCLPVWGAAIRGASRRKEAASPGIRWHAPLPPLPASRSRTCSRCRRSSGT